MPLYEYVCQGCGTRFEVLQRVGASTSGTACPKCGGREVAKQYSTFASAIAGPGASGSLSGGSSSASSCGSGGFS
jgi:putative FmdB family regulatory protein